MSTENGCLADSIRASDERHRWGFAHFNGMVVEAEEAFYRDLAQESHEPGCSILVGRRVAVTSSYCRSDQTRVRLAPRASASARTTRRT